MCSFLYMRYVKSRHPNSRIRLDGDSFLVKTFLVASSLISIFSIGTSVQFFNPSAGLDQFFVIFVLVVWLKYALSDLKQKLDNFVVPEKLEEEPQTLIVPPPPPSPEPYEVEGTEATGSAASGVEQLLQILRSFMSVWEQYERLSDEDREQSASSARAEARVDSSMLLGVGSRYADSWDQDLKRQVQDASDALHKFGISDRTSQTSEAKGKDAYDKVSTLVSLLKGDPTSWPFP
jgi:hypothetical protein